MQPLVSPVVVVTVTGAMQLDRAAWLALGETADLVELRLDTLGEDAGPVTPTMVAPLIAHVRTLLPETPLLATAARAAEAAGLCTSREQVIELLRAAVQAGVDWFDLDVALLEARPFEALPKSTNALDELFQSIVGSRRETRCVVSAHWTSYGDLSLSPTPFEQVRAVRDELLEKGYASSALKCVEVHAAGTPATPEKQGSAQRERALAGLRHVHQARLALEAEGAGAQRAHLAMFAGGASGAALRPIVTAFGSDWIYAAAAPDANRPVPGQWTVASLRAMWPGGRAPAWGTPVFGVLGERIAGSASPALFTALFEGTQTAGVYGRLDVADPSVVFDLLTTKGLPFAGLSVTAPHKGRAWWLGGGDRETGGLKGLGAYNTLVRRGDAEWSGFNTDLLGVRAAAEALVDEDWFARPRQVVVLGAGGAARAVLKALGDARATAWGAAWLAAWRAGAATLNTADVTAFDSATAIPVGSRMDLIVLARHPKRAMALAREFGAGFGSFDELANLRPDLVVHTTPIGSPASSEPHAWLPGAHALALLAQAAPACAILDANYKPDPTPLVAAAHACGLRAATGRHWFWAQAAAQLALFSDPAQPVELPASSAAFESLLEAENARPAVEILIGQRGVGKSTVGAAWAAASGARFRDLDAELAAAHGAASAGELFAARGAAAFRALETQHMLDALAQGAAGGSEVWATGGGLVTTPTARAALAAARASGLVRCTWLTAAPAVLAARVAADPTLRPALFGASPGARDPDQPAEPNPRFEAELVMRARAPWYQALADRTLDVSALDVSAVVAQLSM
jgi:shikimate 5-dehydrogenase/shikimate kinase/3-dehydroquinate dehydratase